MANNDPFVSERLEISPESFKKFAQFITSKLGIKMPDTKVTMLQSRLQRRLRELRIPTLDEYQTFLFNSPDAQEEMIHFINAVTTNKTDFFREPYHFEYLTQTALPTLGESKRPGAPWLMKLWCAGCSSGEEPYTQAMVLSEYAKQRSGFDFAILATDISTRVLDHAQFGIYDESRMEPIPIPLRKNYLMHNKDKIRIVPELRRKISFHRLNFMDEDYAVKDEFDVIFFRNVMIYFDEPTQEAVINKLCRNLKAGGYLFAGHSESLAGLDIPVTSIGSAIYQKLR